MSRDKRMTTRQTVKLVQAAYDRYDRLAEETLRQEFGFTDANIARFGEAFSEKVAEECLRIEGRLRR